ncbi:ABC transporter related protein [Kribbella flavida DSM 17836]|uniref:ABC transporter related protein n=1 Tax=Kribbella flavida (strain DSM 17836 / JCM 10339 / NBRC 14399) TaxID=479435 RepID=D2Q0Z2_KRIFD|nr:ABC transporter ATP-binding protein [Kribbella flavida]ADB35693.1 ABC transporter related protein [Kribbella flavida DSM 17836]
MENPVETTIEPTVTPTVAHSLSVEQLAVGYEQREIIHDLSVRIPTGKITVIVGANACGKSTLLKTMARLLKPSRGTVLLDGKSIQQVSTREVATKLGLLPQSPTAPEGITVADLVGRGRYPHQGWIRQWTKADDEAVADAMLSTDVLEIADRPIDELSGGQRQRVWIAMALAQQTDILLLDEPTTFLDLTHQFEVLDLLVDLNRRDDRTIVLVLHDLNQACRFGDHLIAMKGGRIVAEGNPRQVITEQVVHDVFGLAVKVIPDPVAGTPMVVPIGRHTTRVDAPAALRDDLSPQAGSAAASPAARALAASALANGICRPTDR